jgi:hypothetical protein
MARRPVPPPRPRAPILTAGQKRRRIERLQKCITSLEAFDHQKLRKRFSSPEVVTLEAAINKALSSAFGYGTPAYLRYNLAAKLDSGPVITNTALAGAGVHPVGGPARHEAQAREARQYFSEGRERSIALLRDAIRTLEDEITAAQPIVAAPKESIAAQKASKVQTTQLQPTQTAAQSIVAASKESRDAQKTSNVHTPQLQPTQGGGIDLKAAWRRVRQWLGGRN